MKEYIQFKGNNPFGSQSKMLYHIDRVYEYLYKGDTIPIFMEINLTSKCNLACEWCISANFNRKDTIKKEPLLKFLKDFKRLGGEAITFSGGGEPTLHPDFPEIVTKSKEIGLHLGLMTNGVYPAKYNDVIGSNFDWVRFSLDTVDREKYKKWKGVDKVDQVLVNIHSLIDYPTKVGINCNVYKEHTVQDVLDLYEIKDNTEIDYLQFRPVLPRYFENEKPYINEEVWNFLDIMNGSDTTNFSNDKLNDIRFNNLLTFTSCEGHFFEPVLDANGNLVVCMYHPDDDRFVFGNIYEYEDNLFESIWKSDKRKHVIEFVRKFNYKKECQACCKLTEINKFIDFVKHPEWGRDIHFL